ncbi:MAG: MCE family protein [candidate division Zixibacteria bacterium]|nr:MCE family protein [candidate division Zixibacteria bacterium]
MRDKSIELRVGVVVLLACAILIFGVIWVKGIRFDQTRYRYSVIFPNVGSLEVGDPVSVSGVPKGKVEKIRLYQGDVLVTFNLTTDVVLKKDAEFTIMNVGLMGERFLAVETGYSDTLLDLTQPIRGYYDTGIPEVMGKMDEMIAQIRRLAEHLEAVVGTQSSQDALIQTIKNLKEISQKTNALLDRNQKKFDQTLKDLSYSSAELKKMVVENKNKFQSTVDNFSSASEKLNNITTTLDTLSISLKNLTSKIESGEGTLGQLINDTTLYEQIKKTTQDVDSLILDIKKHPKKYLKISIF